MLLAVIDAADGFALTMVGILTLGLGVVALLLISISRHGKRRNHEVEALIDEVRRQEAAEKQTTPAAADPSRQPWEKDAEWWKQ
ncbi:MAG: hypothetical protein EAZ65_05275 [Verrucomicrobia bacterium]|nr:MAG: hypothetical protein EAZ84_02000 [Verrucomicrobiota bacterium]TAE87535.1 MAG: hypothetical protein EAZ82_07640 [Verrucomicrobiota bacterium]TAF25815.1 MAG: hypothetical protein EAZ71_06625 [Verrucomicrobiota bacterium]TAF41603.1 MAG: hypothetical protein EAZ65_05275 [Verrucomicrobiota bacterium]